MKDTNKKLKLQYGIAIAAVMLLTFLLNYFQPLYTWDKQLEDLMVQRPAVTDSRIRIIKIDEKTLAELGQYNTWDRNIPAELVELLNADPDMAPAVLTFDILYMNDLTKDGDARFAKACKDAKNVITANNLVYEKTTKQDANGDYYVDELHIRMVEKPYEALNAVTRTGFANTTQDKDGYIRQALAYEDAEEGRIYSLAYETYAAYMEDMGRKPVMPALYANNKFDFIYTGKSSSYEAVSLCDVLNGTVDARTFKDCICRSLRSGHAGCISCGRSERYADVRGGDPCKYCGSIDEWKDGCTGQSSVHLWPAGSGGRTVLCIDAADKSPDLRNLRASADSRRTGGRSSPVSGRICDSAGWTSPGHHRKLCSLCIVPLSDGAKETTGSTGCSEKICGASGRGKGVQKWRVPCGAWWRTKADCSDVCGYPRIYFHVGKDGAGAGGGDP